MCSRDPIFRTNEESSIWRQNDHRNIMQNLSVPFIFQEECQMKIEHVHFHPFFQNYGSVYRKVIFNVFTRSDFRNQQKTDRVNGPLGFHLLQAFGTAKDFLTW